MLKKLSHVSLSFDVLSQLNVVLLRADVTKPGIKLELKNSGFRMFFDIDIVIVISESELMGVEAGIGIGTGSNSSWVLYKYFPHTCSEPRSTWDLALYGNGNAADVAGIGTTKVLPSTATYHAL